MSYGGGPPDGVEIDLYPELLREAVRRGEAASSANKDNQQDEPADGRGSLENDRVSTVRQGRTSGPPDGVEVCLYPELIRAAVAQRETASSANGAKRHELAAKDGSKYRSGPPDGVEVCLYPDLIRRAQREA